MIETTKETIQRVKSIHAIQFLDWINNNFFIPVGSDGNYGLETEHPEFQLTIEGLDKNGIFTSEKLYEMFKKGKGEF